MKNAISTNRHGAVLSTAISLAGLGIALLATAAPVHAGLVIAAPAIVATPGSSGTFDVVITDTDPPGSSPFNIAGDSVELGISGAGVNFTDATVSTVPSYVFQSSFDVANGLTLDATGNAFPKTDLTASDVENDPAQFRTIHPGDTFGLAHVSYAIDPGATLDIHGLTIEDTGGGTSLSDNNGNAILFTITNGSLSVVAVPEPATAALILLATPWLLSRPRNQ